jgi:hypothetical protein
VTTVGVLLLGVVLSLIAARLPLGTEGEHFAGHFSVGVTVLLLLLTVLWVWPQPSPEQMRSIARRVLVAGLALFGIGQLLEGVGAFGYRGNDQVLRDMLNGDEQAHDRGDDSGPCAAPTNRHSPSAGRWLHVTSSARHELTTAGGRHVPHERRTRLARDDDGYPEFLSELVKRWPS